MNLKELERIDGGIREIVLPGGTKIKHSTLENNYWRPANTLIEKLDKRNNSIFKKVFLVKLEQPIEANVGFDSALVRVNSMFFNKIYMLKDNTYIVIETSLPFAIRVRNDLTSPYFENNPQFLVLDKEYYGSKYNEMEKAVFAEDLETLIPGKNTFGNNCSNELECLDKRLIQFFDSEQMKYRGGDQ